MPAWLGQPDPDWRPFTLEQADALAELRRVWSLRASDDRMWAGVPVVQDDGSARVEPLTIDLVEPHCKRYWVGHSTELFVLSPPEAA